MDTENSSGMDVAAKKEQLSAEMKTALDDARSLVKGVGNVAEAGAAAAKASLGERALAAKARLERMQGTAKEKTTQAAEAMGECMSRHPWATASLAIGFGFVAGLCLNAGRRREYRRS